MGCAAHTRLISERFGRRRAADIIPLALGTQGIGSILRPASYCSCIGYKPMFGAINRGVTMA